MLLQTEQATLYSVLNSLLTCSIFVSEGDPDNFLTYFKRATVFLAMGRSKAALPDLDRVLELRPDFFQVRFLLLLRIKLYLSSFISLSVSWFSFYLVSFCSLFAFQFHQDFLKSR